MKHLFTTAIALLLSLSCLHAQRIHFTDTSNRWVVHSSHYDEGTDITFYNDSYVKLKDTLVAGERSYIFCYSEDGIDFTCSNGLILTEDTVLEKVYAKDLSLEDTTTFVLYDFMMEEGDTIYIFSATSFGGPGIYAHICTEVYPDILIGGVAHRAFEVSDGCASYTVIEGLGSLLFPTYPKIGCAERTTYNLICFENSGTQPDFSPLFVNECNLDIGDQNAIKAVINLYPNPASDLLHIRSSLAGSSYTFSVCDITGRQVYKGILKGEINLDISTWPGGMYILKLRDEKGNTTTERFVKQ